MFSAAVLRIDNSILVDDAEIQGHQAKRGSGDGEIWRGLFSIPPDHLRPTMGETITLLLDDDSKVTAVVTEVAGRTVHFRASGRVPVFRGSVKA
jgi:hypothetical protein